MSVASEINKKVYACNGATTEFSFPYKIFSQTDLKVYLRDTADVLTLLTFTTHYTMASINGQNYDDGVNITTVATYANGNTITLLRVVPVTQPADYVENDNFPAEGHENALDRGVMISQQIDEAQDRSIKSPEDEEGVDMTLPTVDEREGGFLGFKVTTGEPIAASALNNDDTPITAYMKTLLDDAAALEARGTLDVDQASKLVAKSADYTITDIDGVKIIDMTTGAANKTATLPTATDNVDREITLRKADGGAGYAILDGEGAETINGTATWEVTEQYGYVTVKSNGTAWIMLNQQGSIYEMWDSTNHDTLSTSWEDQYNLSGIIPGKYLIEYGLNMYNNAAIYVSATIATTVDTEDDAQYTVVTFIDSIGWVFAIKSFRRTFAASTTLYLNAKESGVNGFIRNSDYGKGYIRATRIG